MIWRLIRSGFMSGAMNMALDEALLHAVTNGSSPPILRLYRWRPATVTLGYAQSAAKDINLAACREAGFDLVRRVTGGRAVLHACEVTYAVMAPVQHGCFEGSVLDCYRVIAEALQLALERLGLNARLVAGRRQEPAFQPDRAVCFTAPSQYELLINGCKVAGSAQKRQGRCFLQHGSLPLEIDLDLLARIMPGDATVPPATRFRKVGWLNRWSERPLRIDEVEDQLIAAFQEQLGIQWLESVPGTEELLAAQSLCAEKYSSPTWTFGVGGHPKG
jgi:lipoate-protein ligase A